MIFVPSLGIDDIITHKGVNKMSQQALNESNQVISFLNSIVSIMRKMVLQNHMTLSILIASQGGPYAISHKPHKCCVFIPDGSSKVHLSCDTYG